MDLELTGKHAIVTGASRGIGKAIARQLAREGADVAIVARGLEALQESARELSAETGRRIIAVGADTGQDSSVQSMVETVLNEFRTVHILVNNAATPSSFLSPPLTQERFDAEMNVKVMGYWRCVQAVVPGMKAQGWGRIVNISGLAARMSHSTLASIRNVSVAAMTKNLADTLGPDGINVTVVHPGVTRTDGPGNASPAETADQTRATNSIRKAVDASEVAWVVAFLCSPKSIAISGDAIAVGGGVGNAIHY